MIPATPSTVSLIEIVWTVLSLPGLLLSAYNCAGAVRDLRHHWRDGLQAVGWVGLVKVVLVAIMCGLVLIAGVAAMRVPEPVRPSTAEAAELIGACLILIDAGLLLLATAFTIERRLVVPHVKLHGGVLS